MQNLLCNLISATLVGKTLECQEVIEADWQFCFDTALQQSVLAMSFPVMAALPKELRPPFLLWSKWMAHAQSVAEQSAHKRQVLKKIGGWLAEEGLTTMILKGFSLSVLYPNPNLREFCDVDIFSGENYDAVNACFAKHGIKVSKPDGHHARLTVDGVAVEHHFAFGNSRVRQGNSCSIEEVLQRLATSDPRPTSIQGICYPCPALTALYTGWHAYKHFLHEKVELRHVVDWALALRQLTAEEAEVVDAETGGTLWGRFTETMTAIALHRFSLPPEWFSENEVASASCISSEQEECVWKDILGAMHIANDGATSLHRRLNIGHRLLKNRWKFNSYADTTAERFLWKELVGYIKSVI